MAEERDPQQQPSVGDRLDEWRDAERDADRQVPESAARKMARKRADRAKRTFHDAEDAERELQGDDRPREHPDPEDGESAI